jgi:hypothetical protein
MAELREQMIDAQVAYYRSQIDRHRVNVEILLEKRVGVAEHPDVMETIDQELGQMVEYIDKLSAINTYF